jgi:type IV pilus biogenesis protein CpaD/CtpE
MLPMKKLLLSTLVFILVACNSKTYSSFGVEISDQPTHSYNSIYELAQNGEVNNIILEGEITQTCAKKGCWMDVKVSEQDTLMVRFKDYGFFVPKEGVEGLRTVVKGNAKMDTISVDMLRHYAEDAGDSEEEILNIMEPKYVLEFIAEGVLIEQ